MTSVKRGGVSASCLLVEAAKDYRAVDPDFTDTEIILAYLQDGKPLDEKAGPYRIVIPEEQEWNVGSVRSAK